MPPVCSRWEIFPIVPNGSSKSPKHLVAQTTAAKPWGHLGDIAYAINSHAQANGYSVVEDIGGHGIGLEFHEDPFVSYVTSKGSEMLLVPV